MNEQNNNRNKNYKLTAGIVAGGLVLLTILVIVLSVVLAPGLKDDSLTDDWDDYYWNEDLNPDGPSDADDQSDADDWDDDWRDEQDNEWLEEVLKTEKPILDGVERNIKWDDEAWKEEPENHKPEELWDKEHKYYDGIKNCIREDVDYQLIFEADEELNKNQNVCIRITYYQLEGNIPNLEEINERLKQNADIHLEDYRRKKDLVKNFYGPYGMLMDKLSQSYITYNDDAVLCMVTMHDIKDGFIYGKTLNCITVDLKKGKILENSEILDVSEELVSEFVKACNEQYDYNKYLDYTSEIEILEELGNEKNPIVFYTPCGMEFGVNYMFGEDAWITATIKDYKKYLKKYDLFSE